jgi:uncharacterized surface anchored protein
LPDAVFEIRALEDIYTGDGTLRVAKDEIVDIITTDENGVATSSELYIGKYTISEIQAPAGYLASDTVYEVEISYVDQLTSVSISPITITNLPEVEELVEEEEEEEEVEEEEEEEEEELPKEPEKPKITSPKTGDNINGKLQLIALLISFGIVVALVRHFIVLRK